MVSAAAITCSGHGHLPLLQRKEYLKMFEIKVVPEVNNDISSKKTPDSVIIVRQIKKSGNKAMRAGLKKLEEGLVPLSIAFLPYLFLISIRNSLTPGTAKP